MIAPVSPASTITSPDRPSGASMMPDPTVAATFVEIRAPPTLATAAIASAIRGVSARVEIAIAIALAAS